MGDRPSQGSPRQRGQLPLSLLEAAIGITLLLGVTLGFALGVPAPDTGEAQLDAYAEDVVTVLAGERPRHQGATRLSEIIRSPATFRRERAALGRRIDRLLPANVMYRVVTPHGAVGYRKPASVVTGHATVTTVNGAVAVRVWYV